MDTVYIATYIGQPSDSQSRVLFFSPLAVLIIDLLLNGDQDDNESYGGGTGYGAPTTGYEQPSTGYGVQDSYGAAPAPQSYAPAAPAQLAYPAVPANVPAQSYAPAAPTASYGGGQLAGHLAGQGAGLNYDSRVWNNQCYNNLGDGVECRKLGGNPQY